MEYCAYVIKNESGKIYIGHTEDIEKRLRQHNDKELDKRSFAKLNPGKWSLLYKENFKTREEAMRREKELKSSRGRDFIRNKLLTAL